MNDDDDFWTTWIATTPDEDKDFRGCGCWLLLVAAILIVLVLAATAFGRVIDGDSLVIDGERIRLEGIDAPELKQPYGREARQALVALVARGSVVVKRTGIDRYGRTLANVYADGVWVNLEMVRIGAAWHYRQYSKSVMLARAEHGARQARAGLWADPKPIPPWIHRKLK